MLEHTSKLSSGEANTVNFPPSTQQTKPIIATWRGHTETAPTLRSAIAKGFVALPTGLKLYLFTVIAAQLCVTFLVNTAHPYTLQTMFNLLWFPFCHGLSLVTNHLRWLKCNDLLDPDATTRQDLVRVSLTHKRQTYSEDVGVLMLEDGLLTFQGLRTNFAVTAEFYCIDSDGVRMKHKDAGDSCDLRFEVEGEVFYASFTQISDSRPFAKQARGLIDEKLFVWIKDKNPTNKQVILPPTTPSPDSYLLSQRLRLVGVAVLPVWFVICGMPFLSDVAHGRPTTEFLMWDLGLLCAVNGVGLYMFRQANKLDQILESMRAKGQHPSLPQNI